MFIKAFLASTLRDDYIQWHRYAFIGKLLLDAVQKLSEQFVVALDCGRMLTRCLGLDLRWQSVQPLRHLLGVKACLTIRNDESWRSEALDPKLANGADDGLRRLIWEYSRDREPDRLTNDV